MFGNVSIVRRYRPNSVAWGNIVTLGHNVSISYAMEICHGKGPQSNLMYKNYLEEFQNIHIDLYLSETDLQTWGKYLSDKECTAPGVLPWSGGHEFESRLGRTWGA